MVLKALNPLQMSGLGDPETLVSTNFFFDGDDDDDSLAYENYSTSKRDDRSDETLNGLLSPTTELKSLRNEIKLNLNSFDTMGRGMALEMLKDKIELRRGLRGLAPLSPRFQRLSNEERTQALNYVKGRVQDLRKARTAKIAPTKAKQVGKKIAKLQKPVKHQLTRMSERKENELQKPTKNLTTKTAGRKNARLLRPSNSQPTNQHRETII